MKPKEYVKKYGIGKSEHINVNGITADIAIDFQSLLEFHQGSGDWHYGKFENCVKDIRAKFDSIANRSKGGLQEKHWKYFFATVVVPIREKMFGEFLRQKKEQRQQEREDRERYRWGGSYDPFDDLRAFLASMLALENPVPVDAFQKLGLEESASAADVKASHRKLALQHHPDRGGRPADFRDITEAKNRCLAYLEAGA